MSLTLSVRLKRKASKNFKGVLNRCFRWKKELAKILGTVFHNQPSPQGWNGPIFKSKYSFGLQM